MLLKLLYVDRTSKSKPCRNLMEIHRICMVSLCTMSVLVVFELWLVLVVLMFTFALNSNFGISGTEIELHRLCDTNSSTSHYEGGGTRGRVDTDGNGGIPQKKPRSPDSVSLL